VRGAPAIIDDAIRGRVERTEDEGSTMGHIEATYYYILSHYMHMTREEVPNMHIRACWKQLLKIQFLHHKYRITKKQEAAQKELNAN